MRLLILAPLLLVAGCQTLSSYCDQAEARAVLRDLNPIQIIDYAAIGGCAAIQAFTQEEKTMYEKYPNVVFVADIPADGIAAGAIGKLLDDEPQFDHISERTGLPVRIYGKTVTVPPEALDLEPFKPKPQENLNDGRPTTNGEAGSSSGGASGSGIINFGNPLNGEEFDAAPG